MQWLVLKTEANPYGPYGIITLTALKFIIFLCISVSDFLALYFLLLTER